MHIVEIGYEGSVWRYLVDASDAKVAEVKAMNAWRYYNERIAASSDSREERKQVRIVGCTPVQFDDTGVYETF